MDMVSELVSRIEECKQAVARAKEEMAIYEAALATERRRIAGRGAARRMRRPKQVRNHVVSDSNGNGHVVSVNKTDQVRAFIKDNPGATRHVVLEFARNNVESQNNFGSTALWKMQKRNEIEIREGRVYPLNLLLA